MLLCRVSRILAASGFSCISRGKRPCSTGFMMGHCHLASSIAFLGVTFILDWWPVPPDLGHARTPASTNVVICYFIGR